MVIAAEELRIGRVSIWAEAEVDKLNAKAKKQIVAR
tara:strand:- start:310 stop:417 length:108 start_codon:yes stop_codon:yes gene_type:complete